MKASKFNVGELVLYKNGDIYELGVVKEVIQKVGPSMGGDTPGSISTCDIVHKGWKYRVCYHTGDTTATTDEELLFKLQNEYAFTIIRRTADYSDYNTCPARQLAADLLDGFDFKGEAYYKLEDYFTARLQGIQAKFPYEIDSEYLECAIRFEVKDFLESYADLIDYNDDDIDCIVDEVMTENVLDVKRIREIASNKMEENE